ncbi:MAG: hypothetical protein ABSC18_13850 [Verrucomicrobiota bacterium]|jgi:hypothetical protein
MAIAPGKDHTRRAQAAIFDNDALSMDLQVNDPLRDLQWLPGYRRLYAARTLGYILRHEHDHGYFGS